MIPREAEEYCFRWGSSRQGFFPLFQTIYYSYTWWSIQFTKNNVENSPAVLQLFSWECAFGNNAGSLASHLLWILPGRWISIIFASLLTQWEITVQTPCPVWHLSGALSPEGREQTPLWEVRGNCWQQLWKETFKHVLRPFSSLWTLPVKWDLTLS